MLASDGGRKQMYSEAEKALKAMWKPQDNEGKLKKRLKTRLQAKASR